MSRVRQLQKTLSRWFKPVELAGRYFFEWLAGWLLASEPQARIELPARPRFLVVRLDQRVGNLLLLTPFLASLRRNFPDAHIALLCHEKVDRVVAQQPHVDERFHYVKWGFFSDRSIFALLRRLRAKSFDVAFDAGSFDTASITHPLLTRLAGAKSTVGVQRPRVGRMFNLSVGRPAVSLPESEQRQALLSVFGESTERVKQMTYVSTHRLQALQTEHAAFVASVTSDPANTLVFIVGGRLPSRQLSTEEWGAVINSLPPNRRVCLVFGPGEREQAERLLQLVPRATLAPDSTLDQLAVLASLVRGVVGHDTGTSHLAAAVGARLLVVFVATDPERYGHRAPGQTWVDVRGANSSARVQAVCDAVRAWEAEA